MPNWKSEIREQLAKLSLSPTREAEIIEELSQHLADRFEDWLARGIDESEAYRRTLAELKASDLLAQELSKVEKPVRQEPIPLGTGGRTHLIADLWQDLSYAVRVMRKAPGYTVIAVLALALGIGVNTAILGAVNGFVLRPLPVSKPDELVVPYWGRKTDREVWGDFSYPNFVDLREQNRSFSDICAWTEVSAGISSSESRKAGDSERAEVVWGEIVTSNYFDVMGVKPILGRGFLPEEDHAPNGNAVAVLGHLLWQRRFSADPGIVGKSVYLNGQQFTVIGIMPESFLGSVFYLREAFWVPVTMAEKFGRRAEWRTDRSYAFFNLYGRLKPGVTYQQGEADLNLVAESLAKLYPRENADTKVRLTTELDSRYENATKGIRYGGLLALCVSSLVLLVACANVANLSLARSAIRAKEIGIRLAIGASRGRIVRQLLTESIVLASLGGLLGWVLAYRATDVIWAVFPPVPYPISINFAPDGYVLKWMAVISLLTGVIFGLAPALLAARTDLLGVIKGAMGPSPSRRRWNLRNALVVAQVTISIIVLICAGLFVRSLSKVAETDPGFKTENLVTMMINPGLLAYSNEETAKRFFPELLRRVEAQPGVRAAALVNEMPLMVGHMTRGPIVKEGEIDPPPNQGITTECSLVTPKYFDTLQTPILLGRDFTERDNPDAPRVVIINQEFARKFYGSEQNALGKRFRFAQGSPLMEVIGIAKDGLYQNLYEDRQIYIFLPVYQHPRASMTLLVSAHSSVALPSIAENVRREIAQLDARLPVVGVMLAEENLSLAFWGPRIAAGMGSAFGLLALLLATMGLYSVMMYTVSQRTKEIGIRMALGAQVRDVLRLIVSQGMRLVLIGIALGLTGALALTRMFTSLLIGISPADPITFIGVVILLLAIAVLACFVPARRATKVDPLVSLRSE